MAWRRPKRKRRAAVEVRSPESEIRKKFEIRNPKADARFGSSGFGFRISFGLRTSAFGLSPPRRAGEPSQVSPAGIACPAGNSERSSSAERSSITVF